MTASVEIPPLADANMWLQAVWKELSALLKNTTFDKDAVADKDDSVVLVTDVLKAKLRVDGKIEKLKYCLAARGDLDPARHEENNWCPAASFRTLKVFVADVAREGNTIFQADLFQLTCKRP
jgi:hypothetical protein